MTDKLSKFKTSSLLNKVPPPPPKSNQPSPSTSTPASPNVNSTSNSPITTSANTSPSNMSPLLNSSSTPTLTENNIANKSSVSFLNNNNNLSSPSSPSASSTNNKSLNSSSNTIKNSSTIYRASTTLAQLNSSSLPNTENSPPSSSLISSSSSPTAESLLYSEDSLTSGSSVVVDPNTKNANIYNTGLRNFNTDIQPHHNHTLCASDDAYYLFGGTLPDGSYTNDLYSFQFAIKTWSALSINNTPSIRTRHSGVNWNNSMVIFGGYSPSGPKNDIHIFSFDTQSWSEIQTEGTKPLPRYGHSAVIDGPHMIIFGGISYDSSTKQQTVNNEIYSLNLETKVWSQVLATCSPSPRTHHSATIHKGVMYIFGGQDQQVNQLEDIHCYTLANNSWKVANFEGSQMSPRIDHSAILFQESIIISGGNSKNSPSQILEIYEYDLYQKKCFKISTSTTIQNRIGHSSIVKGNSILFWGGCTDSSFDYFSFGKDEFEEDFLQDDYEASRIQNIPKELWEASLMKKHPEILELREKTLAFTGSKSFAKTLATPSFSENKLALSHQFVLQLIMEYLERNTYHKVIQAIQKESGVLHQPTESGESRLVSLLRLVKPRLRNKNVFDTDLSLFSKEETNDPEVPVVDHLYHDFRRFDEEEDTNVWEEGEDNPRTIRKTETENGQTQIKAATFNKLIHYLVPKEKAFDPNFLKVFLYTHSSFTTSEKLLKKLIQRYAVPNANANDPKYKAEVVEPVRQRVCDVLKYWVDKCSWDFKSGPSSSVLMATLNNFIDGSLTRDLNPNIKKLREAKKKLTQEVIPYSGPPPEPKVPKNIFSPQLTLSHIDELEIARQMTLVESKLFGNIPPPEFMVRVIGYGEFQYNMATSPNLMTFLNRATDVSRWVVYTVLNESRDKKNKMKMLDKFIRTLECLRQLNNFQTLHSMLQGLQHPLLAARQDLFTPRHREIIAEQENLFTKTDNYRLYRDALAKAQPACVPLIDIIREDIATIEKDQPSNMNNLINFTKRQNLYNILTIILNKYQFPYNLQIVHQVSTFINKLPKYTEYDLSNLAESLSSVVNSPVVGLYQQPSLIGTTGSSSSINLGSARELNNSNNSLSGSTSSNNNNNSSGNINNISNSGSGSNNSLNQSTSSLNIGSNNPSPIVKL